MRDRTMAMLQTATRLAAGLEFVRRSPPSTQNKLLHHESELGCHGFRSPCLELNGCIICEITSLLKGSNRTSLTSMFLSNVLADIVSPLDAAVSPYVDVYSMATHLPCTIVERDRKLTAASIDPFRSEFANDPTTSGGASSKNPELLQHFPERISHLEIPSFGTTMSGDGGARLDVTDNLNNRVLLDAPSSVDQAVRLDNLTSTKSSRLIPSSNAFVTSSHLLHTHYAKFIGLATAWRSLKQVQTTSSLVAVIDLFLPGFSSFEFHRCSEVSHWCRGWNFGNPTADALPPSTSTGFRPAWSQSSVAHHGTFVGSVIAGGPRGGVAGLCPFCVIVPLNIHIPEQTRDPVGSVANLLKALEFLLNRPLIKLSNLAMNFAGRSPSLERAFLLLEKKGHIMVVAAGNTATNLDSAGVFQVPQMLRRRNILVVGAVDTSRSHKHSRAENLIQVANFSNYGSQVVNLFAPGVNILAASGKDGRVLNFSGTSAAAPLVTSAVALLWAKFPNWSYLDVVSHLQNSSFPLKQLQGMAITEGSLQIGTAMTRPVTSNFGRSEAAGSH